MRSLLILCSLLFCALGLCAGHALAQQEIVSLPTRTGVTQSYFLTSIPKRLHGIALLFPGSGGSIQLRSENGRPRFNQGNFLVRSRSEFIKRGIAAAILDAPSDQQRGWGMSDEFRLGPEHLTDISAVLADLRKRFPDAPLFLIGTSRGTISAAAVAARLAALSADLRIRRPTAPIRPVRRVQPARFPRTGSQHGGRDRQLDAQETPPRGSEVGKTNLTAATQSTQSSEEEDSESAEHFCVGRSMLRPYRRLRNETNFFTSTEHKD